MSLKLGTVDITNLRLGTTAVTKLMLGTTQVWPVVPPAPAMLSFPGVAGNYLTVPHAANLNVTGDFELVVRMSMPDWTPAAANVVGGKNGQYILYAVTNGTFQLYVVVPGGGVFVASTAHGFADGTTGWVKATRVAATGVVSFYTAADSPTEPTTWTARGTPSTNAGAIGATSNVLQLGAYTGTQLLAARVLRFILRDGIAGTTVLDINEDNANANITTGFTATTGQTVTATVTGANQIIQPRPAPPGPTWNFDFTDDPDGEPAGWLTVWGLEVGNATVISGLYRCPQDWWHSDVRPTATNATNKVYGRGEFTYSQLETLDMATGATSNVRDGQLIGVRLGSDGTLLELVLGGGHSRGTWTPPPINTPFIVEMTVDLAAASLVVKVDGVTVMSTPPVGTPASLPYIATSMGGHTGMRKWSSGDA